MKIIGLTGSIGMGKSSTASLCRLLSIPVFESDLCVHRLMQQPDIAQKIIDHFPNAWDKKKKCIDRKILGDLIFKDSLKKDILEKILHSQVQREQQKFIQRMRKEGKRMVVLDIPLLYETGADQRLGMDEVWVVTAPSFLQRQRVLKRANMSDEKFNSILKTQLSDLQKRRMAQRVVKTSLGRAYTMHRIKTFLKKETNHA
jgi:dephospho-CoA kinase